MPSPTSLNLSLGLEGLVRVWGCWGTGEGQSYSLFTAARQLLMNIKIAVRPGAVRTAILCCLWAEPQAAPGTTNGNIRPGNRLDKTLYFEKPPLTSPP